MREPFYPTDHFEIYCFCPLITFIEKDNIIMKKDTLFFLVGGFDEQKREGKIKLFKVIPNEKAYDSKIEYVQDIEFEEKNGFQGFNGPVNYIIQSKNTLNILASDGGGKAYVLTDPNLSYYYDS